jgi:hypothetical protein
MTRQTLTAVAGALALSLVAADARAERRRKPKESAAAAGPAASAADIPVLANLLEKTGWVPTPELSGGFQPGDIFAVTEHGHQWQGDGCFAAEARVSTYTATEVVAQLQVGVSTPLAGAEVGLSKKVKFGTPMHEALPGMGLLPTEDCLRSLHAAARTHDLSGWYVVKEVLRAEITEQTCGRIDAKGAFNPVVQMDASLSSSCAMGSLEPVAVAFRTLPVSELFDAEAAGAVAAPAAAPASADGAPAADDPRFEGPGPYLVNADGVVPVPANTRRIRSAHECGLAGAAMDSKKYVALAAKDIPTARVGQVVISGATHPPHLYSLVASSTAGKCYFTETRFGVPLPTDLPASFDRTFRSTVRDVDWKVSGGLHWGRVKLPAGEYLLESSGRLYTFAVGADE